LRIQAAVTAPLVTYFMPTLVDVLGGQGSGFAIQVPDPTAAAAYVEFLGNLGELVMLALVIAYGGIVSSEVRSGTGALTLAKPLSRSAFVLAKWLSQLVVIAVAGAAATAICIGVTAAFLAQPRLESQRHLRRDACVPVQYSRPGNARHAQLLGRLSDGQVQRGQHVVTQGQAWMWRIEHACHCRCSIGQ
jgi:hypothetical protein